jgi:hypothetical protein
MWNETYEALSNYDKGEFRRLVNFLLSHTYLVRDIYRPDKQYMDINPDFRMVNRLFDVMSKYLAVTGWKLELDDNYGVVSLTNEFDNNRCRDMDRFTTLFLYTCRLIYEEDRADGNSHHIVKTDTSAVVEKMRTLGLLDKGKTTQKERINAQRTLARFNIIQKMEPTAWSTEGNGILIYSSILNIIPNSAINNMYEQLEELKFADKNDVSDEREESE